MNRRICIAPMMEWTDRHYRYLIRLLSQHTVLYTEMVTTGALLYGKQFGLLDYNQEEHPIALQLGGSVPTELAACSRLAKAHGYDEVNLNVGCPSARVQKGQIGACLMEKPQLVAECVDAMRAAVDIPITVKTRIGVDDHDSYEHLHHFISSVAQAGCEVFIIHARKAWLNGLSPKQNREVPPLRYDRVLQLKQDFPHLTIIMNGGIQTMDDIHSHLQHVDGVMIGREAYYNPYFFAEMDNIFFNGQVEIKTPHTVIEEFMEYMVRQMESGILLKHMTKHILNFFKNTPGAKQWRRHLSENVHKEGADISIVQQALECLG